MARINISQILMKRGNTTAANTYVGPLGELVVDTGLRTIRVQDGVTAGGMSTLATNVQLQALGTYANATFGTSGYGNANVALHLLTSSIIGNINANITAANAAIISLTSNAATQATLINAINANVTAANAAITSLTSNAAIQASLLDTLTGNAASQSTLLDTLTANAATQSISLSTLLSNAVTQQTSLTDLVANAATQAQAIANATGTYGNATVEAYIGANIGTLYSNAATQAGSISTLQTQVYANANVAAYLPTYSGNIAGNIVKSGYTWTFSNTGTTTFPTGVRLSNARGANTVNFTTDIDKSFQIETQTSTTSRLWSFGTDGNLTLPQFANINFSNGVNILSTVGATYGNTQVAAYLPTYTGNITAGNLTITGNLDQPNRGFGNGPGTDLYITAGHTQGCSIPGGDTIISGGLGYNGVAHNGGNVTLRTGNYYSKQWNFDYAGTTTFPTNISIDYSGGNVQFPRIIADSGKAFSIQGQGNIGSAALSWTVDPDAAGQYAAVGVTKGGGDNLAKVILQAQSDSGDAATAKTWVFNQTGTTRFPGDTILAPAGTSVTMQSDNYSQLMWENANVTVAPNMAINSNFYVTQNNATLDIGYRDGSSTQLIKSWYWNVDGGMSFPDTTTQYTAFSNAAVATYLANYDGGINFTASPAVITGLGNISSANFTFANGVNILSTVTDLYANAAVQSANIATLFSNAATQATSINTINNTLTSSNVGIGAGAGSESQGTSAVAVGSGAGSLNQGLYSVAIGNDAGADNQGDRSVAVGTGAGRTNQGDYAVAIGRNAGFTNQGNNSIIINATTGTLNQITANTFTVAPVRNDVSNVAQILFYNTTNKEITYGNTINIAGNINAAQYNFANGVNILSTVAGTYGNTQVVAYLPTHTGNVSAVNFVGTIQAQVGSSFAYATDAFGSLYDSGSVFLPADINSNAVVAGYTIVGNSGAVTLTVTSATFVAGTPDFVTVATTPTASSLAYPVTVYSANYSPALPTSTITVGNATVTGNINAGQFNFANGVNILSTVGAGAYGNASVATYLLHFDGDIEFTSSTARIGNVDVITVGDHIRSPAYQFSNGVSILSNVVSKTTGSWTVTTGTNTYSFTVPTSGTYSMWVDCNIPNGIIAWNATATVTNTNVPVVGAQYAWVYTGGGTPIDFVSIPNQFTGTGNTIVRSNTAPSATTNRFDFGINNASGGNVTVRYGWIAIS